VTRRELVAALVLAVRVAVAKSSDGFVQDPRHSRLEEFFEGRPAEKFAGRFLEESDSHGLDWRLLPALAFVETGGGKRVKRENNWFGWNSGRARFATVEDAIHTIAEKLTESVLYRGKSLNAKMRTFNRHPSYPARVRRVMGNIGPLVLETRHEERNDESDSLGGDQVAGPGIGPGK
jgi:hypothetical protein